MTLTFNEETHEYRLDGELVPSVSELLRPITSEQFAAISPEVLRIAAERGTEVHEICQSIDYGLDIDPAEATPDVWGYVEAYQQFLYDHAVEWYGIEEMGACTDFPVDYAGTVDRWGMVDGKLAVVDIKTVAQPSIEQKIAVTLQTYMYDWMVGEKHDTTIEKIYALYLKKDGDYTLMDCDEFASKEKMTPFAFIHDLMALYLKEREIKDKVHEIKERHRRKKKDE